MTEKNFSREKIVSRVVGTESENLLKQKLSVSLIHFYKTATVILVNLNSPVTFSTKIYLLKQTNQKVLCKLYPQ